jgi:hypothetical protein
MWIQRNSLYNAADRREGDGRNSSDNTTGPAVPRGSAGPVIQVVYQET